MKKLISVLAVILALGLAAATAVCAATADLTVLSVLGTAVIDGIKDEAYADAVPVEFNQQGDTNGNGMVMDHSDATAYIINDAEYAYVFVDVYDDNLDNSGSIAYDRDSVELFWMVDNAKAQIRYHFDGTVDADSGEDVESAVVITDTGYAVEAKIPITDVFDDKIEICIQINVCEDGLRQYTCYIQGNAEGDRAYARNNRESPNDCWWTLALAGRFEDTIEGEKNEPMEIDRDNFMSLRDSKFGVSLAVRNASGETGLLVGETDGVFGGTVKISWEGSSGLTEDRIGVRGEPELFIMITDGGYLKLPEGAQVGDTGETATYTFTYTDITITADGYDNVVVPGGTLDDIRFTVKQEDGWTSGTSVEIDLTEPVKEQLGLDTEGLCEYLTNVTEVTTTVTFDAWNGRTKDDLDWYLSVLEDEDKNILAIIQRNMDGVMEAKAVIEDETSDLTAKQEALKNAFAALEHTETYVREYHTQSMEVLTEMRAIVEELSSAVEKLEAEAQEQEQQEQQTQQEDSDAQEPGVSGESGEPVNEENEATSSADEENGGGSGVIIGIVIAVVVIIIITAAGSKRKKGVN
ncbi:MAG TPA: hypothetical protein IAC39_05305 [Candidatus Faeciplasma pullistercoris]|uniref:Carbohydrate-binding domain-containing protein n=1 Tax=Candidatus Faeciplasma pullistercoris TaxID=2840800 RepID=A0A9D1KKD0_9FIRM|nr:hypothetical protein [Candidatus Faeciplasma pullistercoris]